MARASALLGATLLLAACGGAATNVPATPVPAPSTSTSTSTSTPPPAPTSPLSPTPDLKSPVPTSLLADLQALGLDAKSLPPIEKLEPKALRGVMKLLARSLGVKCGDCHREGDFAAPTRRKKIAARMWDEFVVKLAFASPDGAALFCDSCHQGRVEQLDRRDKKALSRWMDDNFVAKLKHKDGASQECETCHVDMNMQFLAQWAKG